MVIPDNEVIHSIIARVFRIDEVTTGDVKTGFYLRYRGELTRDSAEAYDLLATALATYNLTPLFRFESGRQTIVLLHGVPQPKRGRPWVNILMFVLTVLCVLFAGTMYSYTGPLPEDPAAQIGVLLAHLWVGWPFAVSLLGILLAHELGHYFVGRARGAAVSLPFFIPFPLPPLGTMGAFIQMKSPPRNVRSLFDLAIAGPLAGLVVGIPVLILGLSLSRVDTTVDTVYTKTATSLDVCPNTVSVGETYTCPDDNLLEGNSPLYLGLKYLVKGELLPSPVRMNTAPILYWARYLLTGHPIPLGGQDVLLHPVAWAGWAGLLVTFLNLLPARQLDGGHVLYAVFGKRVRRVFPFILAATIVMGFLWSGWWVWSVLLFFLVGRTHAEPLDQITQLDPRRRLLAVMMLVIFLLVLTPVPYVTF